MVEEKEIAFEFAPYGLSGKITLKQNDTFQDIQNKVVDYLKTHRKGSVWSFLKPSECNLTKPSWKDNFQIKSVEHLFFKAPFTEEEKNKRIEKYPDVGAMLVVDISTKLFNTLSKRKEESLLEPQKQGKKELHFKIVPTQIRGKIEFDVEDSFLDIKKKIVNYLVEHAKESALVFLKPDEFEMRRQLNMTQFNLPSILSVYNSLYVTKESTEDLFFEIPRTDEEKEKHRKIYLDDTMVVIEIRPELHKMLVNRKLDSILDETFKEFKF